MSIAYEHEQIAELIATHRARLHQLQLKEAALGSAAAEYVAIDIAKAERAIEQLSGQPIEMSVREAYLVNQQYQMRIEGDMAKLDRKVDKVIDLVQDLLKALALHAVIPPPKPSRSTRQPNGGD